MLHFRTVFSSPLDFFDWHCGLLVAVESVKLKKVKHRPRPMQHFDDSITQHIIDGSSTAVEKSVLENDEDSRSNVSSRNFFHTTVPCNCHRADTTMMVM